jgi:hypothetical protein
MLTSLLIVKLVCEIALCSLLGRGALVLLTAGQPQGNPVYGLFRTLTQPFVAVVGWCTPRFVLPRHHALATFLLLSVVWLAATLGKIQWCLQAGMAACR